MSRESDSDLTERLVEKLEWLVDIPSVTRDEQAIADLMEQRLRKSSEHTVERWRHGFLVSPKNRQATHMLVGHLDTVPPSPEQTRRRENGRIYGCGTSDMKAGVAVMLEMFESRPQSSAAYLFYDREEGPLTENGLAPLLDMVKEPLPSIVLEPTNGEIQVGCVGSFHLDVTFTGVRAHAARPWQGRNAIYETLTLLEYLAQRQPDEIEVDGQIFRQVITPTIMTTPTLSNAVPSEAKINLNVRFAPGSDSEALIQEISKMAGPHATVTMLDLASAGDVCHRHEKLAPWIADRQLKVAPKQAWTDVAQLTHRGFPAVNYGPGEPAQAHQLDEWTPIDQLAPCYLNLLALLNPAEA